MTSDRSQKTKRIGCGGLIALVSTSVVVTHAKAQDLTVVVNRHADWTEIYLSASAPDMFKTFDIQPTKITGPDDLIDFGDLKTGTAWLGDILLDKSDIRIGSDDGGFEAMSFMIHPITEKLPMTSPFEGMLAIGVCNGPENGTQIKISDLQAYVGYFTDQGSQGQPIEIALPKDVHTALVVRIHEFDELGKLTQYETQISSDGTLVINAEHSRIGPWKSAFLNIVFNVTGVRFLN